MHPGPMRNGFPRSCALLVAIAGLMLLAGCGKDETAKGKGAGPSPASADWLQAQISATDSVDPELLEDFVAQGGDLDARHSTSGFTALGTVCFEGEVEKARTLLQAGADPNAPDVDGSPPLVDALLAYAEARSDEDARDQFEIVRLLLDSGADPNQAWGPNSSPLLLLAVRYGVAPAVELLLSHGADPSVRSLGGVSMVEYARKNRASAGARPSSYRDYDATIAVLMKYGAR